MKYEAEIKEILISNAIHLIAKGGFEAATTKALTHCGATLPDFKMNEVYIYRIFGSKEALYEAAFLTLDKELVAIFNEALETAPGKTKADFYNIFLKAWEFILANEENCRCYVRYYYSIYFKEKSREEHEKLFAQIISNVSAIFKDEADVPAILHSVFIMLLDFAIRVYDKELADDDINRPHIFNVLYCMMVTYFNEATRNALCV